MPKDQPLEELVEEGNERARRRRERLRTAGEAVATAPAGTAAVVQPPRGRLEGSTVL